MAYSVSDEKVPLYVNVSFSLCSRFSFTLGFQWFYYYILPGCVFLCNHSTCSSLSFLELRFSVCVLVCIICIDSSSSTLVLFSAISSKLINLLKEFFKHDSVFFLTCILYSFLCFLSVFKSPSVCVVHLFNWILCYNDHSLISDTSNIWVILESISVAWFISWKWDIYFHAVFLMSSIFDWIWNILCKQYRLS